MLKELFNIIADDLFTIPIRSLRSSKKQIKMTDSIWSPPSLHSYTVPLLTSYATWTRCQGVVVGALNENYIKGDKLRHSLVI